MGVLQQSLKFGIGANISWQCVGLEVVVGAGSSRSGSLRANQLWAKEEAKEYVFPVSMIALFRIKHQFSIKI